MWSLFSTSPDQSGFRLQYMELYNWGTFDQKVFRISPNSNNSLLTSLSLYFDVDLETIETPILPSLKKG